MPLYTPYTGGPLQGQGFSTLPKQKATAQPKAVEPIESRAEEYKSPGDNSSPAGETIPAGIGASSYDGKIVWWDDFKPAADGEKTASFAMVFGDCLFTGSFSLLKLFADEEILISNVEPVRSSSQKIRYYDGSQTTVDPLLLEKLGADKASSWVGYVYAVFEDFECKDYGRRVPLIRAVLSGAVTANAQPTSGLSSLTFGAYTDPNDENRYSTVDRSRNHHYQLLQPASVPTPAVCHISVIDIRTNAEINRATVFDSSGVDFRRLEYPVALDGSDYFVCCDDDRTLGSSTPRKLILVNAYTGEIVYRLLAANVVPTSGYLYSITSVLIESGLATKYLVFCGAEDDDGGESRFGVALVDVTNETISWVLNPGTTTLGATTDRVYSIAIGPVENGQATFFWNSQDRNSYDIAGFNETVHKGIADSAGVTESVFYTEADSAKSPQGVAYDFTDDTVVVLREDGSVRKLTLAGATVYTSAAQAVTDLSLNAWNYYLDTSFFTYRARPGFAYAQHVGGFGDFGNIYSIDLSDGSVELVIDLEAFDSGFLVPNFNPNRYYDQITGTYMEGAEFDYPGQALKISGVGSVTPDVVDLEDIFTQLATFDDRFLVSDLEFTGFPGNETSGMKLENDTTIDNLEQSIAEVFEVRIVESDGNRKYTYPPRDGSFATDATLTIDDLVERGSQTVEKTFGAGEDELAGATVEYFDVDADYKKLPQPYNRPVGVYDVTRSKKKRTFNTILSLSASQAVELATLLVYRSTHGNETFSFSIVPGFSHLEPGDILSIPFRGGSAIVRVKEATIKADYSQDVLAYQYMRFADATFTGATLSQPDPEAVSAFARLIYLDVPLLSYAHDLGGTALVQYVQPAGYGAGSITAAAYKSTDGSTYTNVGVRAGIAPIAGTVVEVSGYPADPSVEDGTNTITVNITSGDVAAIEAGMRAAIGAPGRWCVITFDGVSATGGQVELSDLLWGFDNGSEVWRDEVTVGDAFVLIDADHWIRFSNPTTLLDETVYYKGATAAMPLGLSPTLAHAAAAVAETPYAPVNLAAALDGNSPPGIDLSWDYRSRLATGLNPTNHGEASLSFEVDIIAADSPGVIRTLTSATNSVNYTGAQVIADFGTLPESITFRVYQMSALVGRGYGGEATTGFPEAGMPMGLLLTLTYA